MKKTFFQLNSVLGPTRYFPELIASCSLMPTSPNLKVHKMGPKIFVFIIQKYFKEVLTDKAFKHCMFELRLQIGLYDQNLVRKKRTLISNLI